MLHLSEWSFAQVLIVSIAWVILVVGWQVLRFYLIFRRMRAESRVTGSGGIGAVSVGLFGVVFGMGPFFLSPLQEELSRLF